MSGTKYSYSANAADRTGDSTVVTLKDGSLLEVRRGAQTTWTVGEPRKRWASLAEWMASLPEDAMIKKSGVKKGAPRAPASPLSEAMQRVRQVMDVLSSDLTVKTPYRNRRALTTLGFAASRAEKIAQLRKQRWRYEKIAALAVKMGAPQRSWLPNRLMHVDQQIAATELYYPETSRPLILNSGRNRPYLLARALDGKLHRIYYSFKKDLFATRTMRKITTGSLTELGFSEKPELWIYTPLEETMVCVAPAVDTLEMVD